MFVSFKSEAVSYSIISNANSTSYPDSVDYDTVETVTCSSKFLYNSMRQRSLQHFIEIEELPVQYGIVDLPSGVSRSGLFPLTEIFQHLFRSLRRLWVSSEITQKADAVSNSGDLINHRRLLKYRLTSKSIFPLISENVFNILFVN